MKKIFILIALVFSSFFSKAQKKQNVYFLNKKGKEVKVKDSADFVRVIQEPDSGETNYLLFEFYMDDKKKRQGKVSSFANKLVYEGQLISFDRNGIKESVISYKKGDKIGMAFYYFANKMLKKQVEYIQYQTPTNQMIGSSNGYSQKMRVIFIQDSLGVVTVKDGNGHSKEKAGELKGDALFEEGDYKDGYRNGVWTGKYTINTAKYYTETYEMGKFISGESMQDGKKYTYLVNEAAPEFKGGKKAWADFISRTTSYPKAALEDRASGTVSTSFVIDKDGKITEIKITKSVHEALDKEAIRVLQQSPRWTPGQQRGVPVKVVYTQSFKFSAS